MKAVFAILAIVCIALYILMVKFALEMDMEGFAVGCGVVAFIAFLIFMYLIFGDS